MTVQLRGLCLFRFMQEAQSGLLGDVDLGDFYSHGQEVNKLLLKTYRDQYVKTIPATLGLISWSNMIIFYHMLSA